MSIMDINAFVQKFSEQFDDTDASVFTTETVFRDLDEWSSIVGLSIIAMVDEEFEIALKADDMKKAVTVGDLYEIIKGKQVK